MAIQFNKLNGGAKKSGVTYMKLADGDNTFRIVGGILPCYTYWVVGAGGRNLPFEALQFSRETEAFDNSKGCPVSDLGLLDAKGETLRCQWSYKCQVINKATGQLEVLQLKKGMLTEIISVAQQLELDPTDLETGTWLTVNRKKTGPKAFNVEYSLAQLKCKSTSLEDEFRPLVADLVAIEAKFPVETYESQTTRLSKHLTGEQEDESGGEGKEEIDELG